MEEEKEKENGVGVVRSLIEMVNWISLISEYRCMVKKHYCNLARRLKLLIPLFEENRDTKELVVPEETMEALKSLRKHLNQLRNCLDSVAKGARSTWCVHFCESLFFFFFFFFLIGLCLFSC